MANISSEGAVKAGMSLGQIRALHNNIVKKYGLHAMAYNETLSSYTKFIVVRHPLDRLISAYRDKMRGGDVTFKEGAMKVVERYRTNITNNDTFPTFKEFVKMTLTNSALARNEHWKSYFFKCDPCYVNYDYVLKVETMDHDMRMFLSEVYHDRLSFVSDTRLNSFKPPSELSDNPYSHKLKLFEDLSAEEVEKITSKFHYEHEFYGYSFNQKTLHAGCCDQHISVTEAATKCCC